MNPKDTSITLFAPAKINVYLEVCAKRPDGYHELTMLMAPISLYDEVTLEPLNLPGTIEISCVGRDKVGSGEENICHRAAAYYFKEAGITGGVRISVKKNIPVGAGLGGGSSDGAATIMGLEKIYGKPLSPQARAKAAFEVGADVPFFFSRSWAWVEGIGEKVTPVEAEEPLWLVVVHPGVFLSTAAVFSHRTKVLTTTSLVPTIVQFNFRGVSKGLRNDLQGPAMELEPAIKEAFTALESAGSDTTFLTGSGSAVIGLARHREEAERVTSALTAKAPKEWRIAVAHTLGRVVLFSGD